MAFSISYSFGFDLIAERRVLSYLLLEAQSDLSETNPEVKTLTPSFTIRDSTVFKAYLKSLCWPSVAFMI